MDVARDRVQSLPGAGPPIDLRVPGRLTPLAADLIRTFDLQRGDVTGTGFGGRVTSVDVRRSMDMPQPTTGRRPPRRWIRSVNVTRLAAHLGSASETYREREGYPLSINAFVLKAIANGLCHEPGLLGHGDSPGRADQRIVALVRISEPDRSRVVVIEDPDLRSVHGLNLALAERPAGPGDAAPAPMSELEPTIVIEHGSVEAGPAEPDAGTILTLRLGPLVAGSTTVDTLRGPAASIGTLLPLVATFDDQTCDPNTVARFLDRLSAWLESQGPNAGIF